jgi:hypothetical protein
MIYTVPCRIAVEAKTPREAQAAIQNMLASEKLLKIEYSVSWPILGNLKQTKETSARRIASTDER